MAGRQKKQGHYIEHLLEMEPGPSKGNPSGAGSFKEKFLVRRIPVEKAEVLPDYESGDIYASLGGLGSSPSIVYILVGDILRFMSSSKPFESHF
ncbi:hypothetical protein JTB14_008095 [Gonioctena quinquepunctata]|nr:hypothetical protein JTB14_008095 [Gonioctena quinquepunctata]